ncbi:MULTISPECIES: aromatic-ring-hydroxylating dioxygenase subunit beta [unclassified Rhodococcus (in: high G+C Gram-positive bacteria)]|jgi:3-phenylpropionate/cinnamic acid dioxygenase small subunit|uniref:aromatic-ring-hydroxylating dioxygenase subunit beta n=1 Tax=unclassified Rhodococcus (in: high G+C Gram-positive bacteria) TaxID=192944 RepID=UPI0002FEBEC7|nr:aromatic-ring-hydroxylating dioxygenase subunit beta [Rhodococcus sp. DK17]
MTTVENSAAPALQSAPLPLPAPDADIAAFLNLEARLADEARYSEWELLWDDDALYWVPMHPDDDPKTRLSYIYDNRRRIKSRVAQLNTGNRHSQTPPSVMRRLLSNSEVLDTDEDTVTVGSNFALFEYRYSQRVWAGRVIHRVRRTPGGLKLAEKTVHLISAGGPVDTLAFLI